jgi:UDP-N-acetylglucosamine--N-acetylmuramyl-(pentapeptide) pyrophosphoryl-undecaprenol N-acetylglucosamine transferase
MENAMLEKLIIIAGGGTGGHLYPGIALARELKSKGFTPVFIVKSKDIGREILDKEGLKYFEIPSMGMPRGFSYKLLLFPFIIAAGFMKTFILFRKVKPLAVAGMGGYISFSAVICANILCIPSVIHEQNALPGMTNRILSRFADTVALSFGLSTKYFLGCNSVVTGNPVRPELFKIASAETYGTMFVSKDKFTILVFGGSQGAAKINLAVIDSCEFLKDLKDKIQFLLVSGSRDFQTAQKAFTAKQVPGKVIEYVHSMGDAYAVSDIIISRAGATTVAELRILNKQAVLIPFPFATDNHQEFNARALEKEGIAKVVLEKDLTPQLLAGIITEAFHKNKKEKMFNIPRVYPQALLASEIIKII